MKVSVKIEDDVKADLYRIAGELQIKKKTSISISETIRELITEHDAKRKEA
jgi:predicted transcriptional regulator